MERAARAGVGRVGDRGVPAVRCDVTIVRQPGRGEAVRVHPRRLPRRHDVREGGGNLHGAPGLPEEGGED